MAEALSERGFRVLALLDPRLRASSPRTSAALGSPAFETFVGSALGLRLLPALLRSSALVTACDTTARPHARGYWLTRMARLCGLRTFTLQHGLENIGLTYYDAEYPPQRVDFASDIIFTWGPLSGLDPRVPEAIKRRCVPVGCPKVREPARVPDVKLPFHRDKLVVVFENLHWSRYDGGYRERFLADLEAAAAAFPAVSFLVKPHHSGRWLSERFGGRLPASPNLMLADPKDPVWEPYTAPALIKAADAVITTPSTTVFDSVCMGKPVAVAAYDIPVPLYEPLAIIRSSKGWNEFVGQALDGREGPRLEASARGFRDRVCLPGDGASRIAQYIEGSL